jgi:dGTPase
MIRTRKELEAAEAAFLAPYAQKSGESLGRVHKERKHPTRTEYQRDRARIIHSRAFRRLEYKTQVFLNGTGDHLRTRLTHTFEVANITRMIARSLALNEDLAEAIALAHDLGHPPFGHSGEKMLDHLMKDYGGFDHNAQSLRTVDVIETRYPKFAGLNLSHEVREGLQKHAKFYQGHANAAPHPQPSLEAQLSNLADEITYYSHDLDDGIDFQLLEPKQLEELTVWKENEQEVRLHFPRLKGREFRAYVIRCIIDGQAADVIETSSSLIERARVSSADEVRKCATPLIAYSRPLLKANQQLRRFLYKNLYYHPRVEGANQRACEMLRDVFEAYLKQPKLLGEATSKRVKKDGLHRTVCDYIAGMTDRYLLDEHARLFTPRVYAEFGGRA